MRHTSESALPTQSKSRTASIRLTSAIHLCSGDTVGAFVEHARGFDDKPSFIRKGLRAAETDATRWVADKIRDIAVLCETLCFADRPLILPIPACALTDAHLLDAVTKSISQTRLCHQEISFELPDAALATAGQHVYDFISTFRKNGFRVSIDARKSWISEFSGHTWLMIDTLRINAAEIDVDSDLEIMIETARSAGVAIVAEKPFWRDGDYLASIGIDYGLKPRADA